MKSLLPSFEKVGTDFGGVIYRKWDSDNQQYLFVFLSPSPKFDRFTVELAVNSKGEFPFSLLPGDKSPDGAVRERIRKFTSGVNHGWWNLNRSHEPDMKAILESQEQVFTATSAIPGLVDDAVRRVCEAVPIFLRSLESTQRKS
jgi:hypothetical protein